MGWSPDGGAKARFSRRSEASDLILVRYANVKLGQLDTSAKPRLLPAFSDKGWETKPIKQPAI